VSPDGQYVVVNIGGDVTEKLRVCAPQKPGIPGTSTVPVEPQIATLRPTTPPECCVHILTKDVASITPQTPGLGRLDCPSNAQLHGADVQVFIVQPDGKGGLVAVWIIPGKTNRTQWPVCTIGDQGRDPVPCCIIEVPNKGRFVKCDDQNHPLHGKPAAEAIAEGFTLELCPPPAELPPCCVELGHYEKDGKVYTGRLVCDDPSRPAHGMLVMAEALPDGMYARVIAEVGDRRIQVRLPLCEEEDVPEEIPCCVRDGKLYCPDHPDYHGMPYVEFQQLHGKRLDDCPEIPPSPELLPPDCCVQLDENGQNPILVCSDPSNPWHGYALNEGEYNCNIPEGWCGVLLTAPDGRQAKFKMPLCPPPKPEPVPPDCCYDVATGTLICKGDPDSEWNGLKVSLEQLVSGPPMMAMVSHAKLGSAPVRFPVCEEAPPADCCFDPGPAETGAQGTLVCPGNPELNGKPATLVDLNIVNGQPLATVAWAGGGARMPLCCPPATDRPPECPPPYMCCVNIDNGTYVCPANEALHGQPAAVAGVVEVSGMPFVKLADGTVVPACGSQCPAPEPCPDCPGGGTVPGPGDPCDPVTGIPMTTPGTPQGGAIPTQPPCPMPTGGIPQSAPGAPTGSVPIEPPCIPQARTGGGIPQSAPTPPQGTVPGGGMPCAPGGQPVPQSAPPAPQGTVPTSPGCPT
jgi:hypothetical protein